MSCGYQQIAMVKRNKEKNLHCIWSGDLVPVHVCIMYIDRIKFEFSYILCNSLLSAYYFLKGESAY